MQEHEIQHKILQIKNLKNEMKKLNETGILEHNDSTTRAKKQKYKLYVKLIEKNEQELQQLIGEKSLLKPMLF